MLHGHPERDYTIHDLAARVDIGVRGLQRGFLELGTTFRELRREIRLRRIKDELFAADPGMVTVAEVMDD